MFPDQVESFGPEQMPHFTLDQLRQFDRYPFWDCLTPPQACSMTPEQARVLLDALGDHDSVFQKKRLDEPVVEALRALVTGTEGERAPGRNKDGRS